MKRTIIILSIIFAIIAAFIYYRINSENDSEVVIVNTEAGDSFKLSYDTYKNKSLIEDCNSRFNLVIHNKIGSSCYINLPDMEKSNIEDSQSCIDFISNNSYSIDWSEDNWKNTLNKEVIDW